MELYMRNSVIAGLVFSALTAYGQESWVEKTSLPKIVVSPIPPIANVQAFKREGNYQYYSYKPGAIAPSEPFETDSKAETAAREFVAIHFGSFLTELRTTKILHSASGNAQPQNPDDRGHTISFSTYWHGIELQDLFAVVYFKGRTISAATIQLGKPQIIPGSMRGIVPRTVAVANWRTQAVKHFDAPTDISPQIVNLVFVWSSADNNGRDESKHGSVLSPNWAIRVSDRGEELLVDAYSGRVWRND